MASAIETATANYRRELLALDEAALKRLVGEYARVRERWLTSIDALVDQIAAEGPTPAQAARLSRLNTLLGQIDAEMSRLSGRAYQLTLTGQRAATILAGEHALALAAVQTGSPAGAARLAATWARLPTGAVESLIGRMQDGASLERYFRALPAETATTIQQALVDGIASGLNPNAVAAKLRGQTNIALEKLITVTRNEMLASYRAATLANYQANADILDGWIWVASLSSRTCPACLALHGREFPLTETFQKSHSRCRCSSVPLLKGFDNQLAGGGERFFAAQDAGTQDKILRVMGGGKAYRDGDVDLEDFIVLQKNARWGDSYNPARSLDAAKDNASKRRGGIGKVAA